jgi:hypothetical protein
MRRIAEFDIVPAAQDNPFSLNPLLFTHQAVKVCPCAYLRMPLVTWWLAYSERLE